MKQTHRAAYDMAMADLAGTSSPLPAEHRALTRRAIRVTDDNGRYEFAPHATSMPYHLAVREAMESAIIDAPALKVVEELLGWYEFRWSVRIYGQPFFLTGDERPS